jgi:ribosomal protein S21
VTNVTIIPRGGEPIERTLQRFKKAALMASVFREMKERASYTKPSQRRRLKSKRARLKQRKGQTQIARLEEWYGEKLAPQKLNPWRR